MFYNVFTTLDRLQIGELIPKAAATFVEFQGLQDLKMKVLPQCLEYLENLVDALRSKETQILSCNAACLLF